MIGYISKLEFSVKRGFFWRVILFFRQNPEEKIPYYFNKLDFYWREKITRGRGNCLFNTNNYFFSESDLFNLISFLCVKEYFFKIKKPKNMKIFRRGMITERMARNVKIDKLKKLKLGRKRVIDRDYLLKCYNSGMSASEIASKMNIGRSTVFSIIKDSDIYGK